MKHSSLEAIEFKNSRTNGRSKHRPASLSTQKSFFINNLIQSFTSFDSHNTQLADTKIQCCGGKARLA